ncbi:MAG: hypothetical protein ACP5KN_02615 [Armatimonadota bacterium]
MADSSRCPRCRAKVYPTDDRCMSCGLKLPATPPAEEQPEEEEPPARREPPDALEPTPALLVSEETPALRVDCPRRGCSGIIRVPTTRGSSGRTLCPLCRQRYDYTLGRARLQTHAEVPSRGDVTGWQVRYREHGEGGEAALSFIGHADIEVRPGEEFVYLQAREEPALNVFRNITRGLHWEVHPSSSGCFPVIAAVLASCCIALALAS